MNSTGLANTADDQPPSALGYSIANAHKFGWSSITGALNPERRHLVDTHIVGPRVLDAGCGGGAFVAYLAARGYDILGVDCHDFFLQAATANYPGCRFVAGDVTDLPFADDSFETALCLDVLEHVDDVKALKELGRVASRRLVLAVPRCGDEMAAYGLTFYPYTDATHLRYYTEDQLHETVRRALPGAAIHVRPELHIPTHSLMQYLLGVPPARNGLRARIMRRLLTYALQRITHRKIPTGFSVIVDLQSDSAAAR